MSNSQLLLLKRIRQNNSSLQHLSLGIIRAKIKLIKLKNFQCYLPRKLKKEVHLEVIYELKMLYFYCYSCFA